MEKFCMHHAGMRITISCNLKCALCAAYTPYMQDIPSHLPLVRLKASLIRYFDLVDYVSKFTVLGGEPLLHPDLPEFIELFQQYAEHVGIVEIVTNGSILPSKQLISAAKKLGSKIYFLVDNYGKALSNNLLKIDCLLTEAGITHVIRENNEDYAHCNGWIDYGNLLEKKLFSKEDCEKLYAKCAQPQKMHFCFTIRDGIMYPCASYEICRGFGGIVGNYSEYIDLFDDLLTTAEQRQKIKSIYERKSLSACAYCNGMCEDSQRYTPAVQLTAEELRCVRDGARSYQEVCTMLSVKNEGGEAR